jgi:hypothetical protein
MLHITRLSKTTSAFRSLTLGFLPLVAAKPAVSGFKIYLAVGMVVGLALIVRAVYIGVSNLKEAISAAEWAVQDQC